MLILCDVDGVLCDFAGFVSGKLKRDIVKQRPAPYVLEQLYSVTFDDIKQVVKSSLLTPRAWALMPDMPFVDGMLWLLSQAVKRGHRAFVISNMDALSRYLDSDEEVLSLMYASHSGRAWWLKQKRDNDRRLYRARVEWAFDIDRFRFANENTILIDDNEDNVVRFVREGGHAILVPAPWNSLWKEFEKRQAYMVVKRRLTEILDAHEERCGAVLEQDKVDQCSVPVEGGV